MDGSKETQMVRFTYEEKLADGGVRRKWFDVEHDSLPPVFYLPLHESLTLVPQGYPHLLKYQFPVMIKVARYERVGRRPFPFASKGMDIYKYKGDELR